MEIKLDLKQAKWLVDSIIAGGVTYRAISECVPVLEKSLLNNVFRKPHSDTLEISDKAELANLIRSGSGHKPASARPGAPYSQDYLDRKERENEPYPHKYADYGFWSGTEVEMIGNGIRMSAQEIKHKGFPYMVHHEQRRSVLKRAFLDAWQDLVQTIIGHIAKEARGK